MAVYRANPSSASSKSLARTAEPLESADTCSDDGDDPVVSYVGGTDVRGRKHGRGTETYASGTRFEGRFVCDVKYAVVLCRPSL